MPNQAQPQQSPPAQQAPLKKRTQTFYQVGVHTVMRGKHALCAPPSVFQLGSLWNFS
jgi:hypothetical protein